MGLFGSKKKKEEAAKVNNTGYRVLAVTACPTGIAHTYMAAENLTKKAEEMGYRYNSIFFATPLTREKSSNEPFVLNGRNLEKYVRSE